MNPWVSAIYLKFGDNRLAIWPGQECCSLVLNTVTREARLLYARRYPKANCDRGKCWRFPSSWLTCVGSDLKIVWESSIINNLLWCAADFLKNDIKRKYILLAVYRYTYKLQVLLHITLREKGRGLSAGSATYRFEGEMRIVYTILERGGGESKSRYR